MHYLPFYLGVLVHCGGTVAANSLPVVFWGQLVLSSLNVTVALQATGHQTQPRAHPGEAAHQVVTRGCTRTRYAGQRAHSSDTGPAKGGACAREQVGASCPPLANPAILIDVHVPVLLLDLFTAQCLLQLHVRSSSGPSAIAHGAHTGLGGDHCRSTNGKHPIQGAAEG